ncbi:MAG: protein translocase subunit SecD [Microgenomates group bacterium]
MLSTPFRKLILILLLTLVAFYISLPKEINLFGRNFKRYDLDINVGRFQINKSFDLKLGLDLAGGSHLVFEADTSKIAQDKKSTAIQGVRDVIDRRVNLFGVSEPSVQVSEFQGKDRIIVELPGLKDTKEAVDLIGKTAQLMFAEVEGSSDSAQLVPTNLTGADLQSAQVSFDSNNGKPGISLQFSKEGGDKFSEITSRNIGKALPIILDGEVLSAPIVQERITGGSAQISGTFTVDQAKKLSIQLNAGALPVPISLVEERTVGATLGADSIKASVTAGLIGIIMVISFMILSYGKLGLVADIGLFVFAVITLALYKLIPVTLTLPGIAGFMLSVGMAVDSNILIFERFKEERLKRPVSDALEVSFGRAWDSIRDANIATLVTAFILANPLDWKFLHTSGPVRGFAITLALGIAISLFTGIFVSRNLLRFFIREEKKQ